MGIEGASAARGGRPLFDLDGIDLGARVVDRAGIEAWIPHRHEMSLLDGIVWMAPDRSRGVGVKHIRADEFWVRGHYPGRPMFPGVLMIETGAQLACYLFITRLGELKLAAFLRIEHAAFRRVVAPGDDLYVLCRDVKYQRRRFICDVQGIVRGEVVFDANLSGMTMDGPVS